MASSAEPGGTLRGRTALVAGASRGIGLATARALYGAGARLVLVARGVEALREAAGPLDAAWVACDVADAAAVERLAARVRDETGADAPDIVVNAAGAFELARLAETGPAMFDRLVAANLRGPFLVIHAFLPAMLERGSGHIVSIGSIAGRHAFPENGAYSASKFGLRGLHAVLDAETRGTGVRATLVEPAATDTPLWDAVDRDRHPGLPPRGAMMPATAVSDAIVFALTRPPEVDVRNLLLERS